MYHLELRSKSYELIFSITCNNDSEGSMLNISILQLYFVINIPSSEFQIYHSQNSNWFGRWHWFTLKGNCIGFSWNPSKKPGWEMNKFWNLYSEEESGEIASRKDIPGGLPKARPQATNQNPPFRFVFKDESFLLKAICVRAHTASKYDAR
jgi:hypothetical protein